MIIMNYYNSRRHWNQIIESKARANREDIGDSVGSDGKH